MKYTKEKLEELVKETKSCREFILRLKGFISTGSYTYWKRKVISLKISIDHWQKLDKERTERTIENTLKLDESLEFRPSSSVLRKLALDASIKYECEICGLKKWKGQKLTLPLDHINGNWRDNRIENLRFLCPNCHTLTESYTGKKNLKYKTKEERYLAERTGRCEICQKPIHKTGKKCRKCLLQSRRAIQHCSCGNKISQASINCIKCFGLSKRKVERPSKEELEKLIWEIPTTKIAEKYSVSDKAVAKWCKSYGISKPQRGYWTRQNRKK